MTTSQHGPGYHAWASGWGSPHMSQHAALAGSRQQLVQHPAEQLSSFRHTQSSSRSRRFACSGTFERVSRADQWQRAQQYLAMKATAIGHARLLRADLPIVPVSKVEPLLSFKPHKAADTAAMTEDERLVYASLTTTAVKVLLESARRWPN